MAEALRQTIGGIKVRIGIQVDASVRETEIMISCSQLTPEIEKIIGTLRILNQQLMVTKEDETYILDVSKIIYIEAVDRKTIVYTRDVWYESKLKLYEMEEKLMEYGFLRVSRSCLVQLHYIRSLKNDVERRLCLTLESGERIMVSRQYADEIKRRLGVMKA
ncbi:MAG: LytTR family transcriptional regulator [Lachnospiraceae bacterium]|jgi:DNA-binding LytR/AlgR family response regulator|nr:LytTR family transcriptional regulator [Lachnospiraceae bacterium]